MQKQLKKIGLGLVAVGLSITLLFTVAVPVCEARPDEKVVRIGIHAMLTGPIATFGVPPSYGLIDSLRYINEQGGINGVKIGIEWEDSRAEVPRVIAAHKRFVGRGVVVEWGTIGTTDDTLAMLCPKDRLPALIYDAFRPQTWTGPVNWVFGIAPTWESVAVALGGFMVKKWHEEHPEEADHIVTVAGIVSHDPAARAMSDSLIELLPSFGGKCVGCEYLATFGVIDTSTEWLRTMARNPDWVYVHQVGAGMTVTMKDGARLGYKEKGIKIMASPGTLDALSGRVIVKEAGGAYTGLVSGVSTMTDLPGLKPILEKAAQWRGYKPEQVSLAYIAGWCNSMIMAEAARMAIEGVGYENVDGQAVRDALASMNFDTGLMPHPVTMSDQHPWCADYAWVFVFKQGRLWFVDEAPLDWYPEWFQELIAEASTG